MVEVGFVILNVLLGIATFLVFAGTRQLPACTPDKAHLLQALACGVLVGSVLGIILPEGFEVQAHSEDGEGEMSGLPVVLGYALQVLLDAAANQCAPHAHHPAAASTLPKHSPLPHAPLDDDEEDDDDEDEADEEMAGGAECLEEEEERNRRKSRLLSASHLSSSYTQAAAKGPPPPPSSPEREVVIELSAMGATAAPPPPTAGSKSHEAKALDGSSSKRRESPYRTRHHSHTSHHHLSISSAEGFVDPPSSSLPTADSTTHSCLFSPSFLGLLVHCLADGLALGASSLGGSKSLQWTVFFALTIHKLPVAFATGTYVAKTTTATPRRASSLSQQSYQPRQQHTRRFLYHALAFSLASPLAALLTHAVLRQHSSGGESSAFVGQALLFSGGTFLYVSVGHIMPEVLHSQQHLKGALARRWVVLLTALVGMFAVPFLARLAPEHGH